VHYGRRWAPDERPERVPEPRLSSAASIADTHNDLTMRRCPAEQVAASSPRPRPAPPDEMIGITDTAIGVANRF